MQVTICDKCGRRSDKDTYRVTIQPPLKGVVEDFKKGSDSSQNSVDLCAVCVHPLRDLLPPSVRHLLPSKERAELVAKTALTEAPPG